MNRHEQLARMIADAIRNAEPKEDAKPRPFKPTGNERLDSIGRRVECLLRGGKPALRVVR